MLKSEINTKLRENNIHNKYNIKENKGSYRVAFEGEIWVKQILDLFNVLSWEYSKGKATFYIKR